jgi:Tol biopolymer transport system component
MSGAMTASAIGRATIAARLGALDATAAVSVVPHAWVASEQHFPYGGPPGGVILLQLDGSEPRRLTGTVGDPYESGHGFGWSPDGNELAIARGNTLDVFSADGATRQLVAMSSAMWLGARFSADGQWIYFANAGSSWQTRGLYRIRRDGTGLEHLAAPGSSGDDYRPSPSPDGQSIVYGSSQCNPVCIRVLDIATRTIRTYGSNDFLVRGTTAAWSPTGDVIAYTDPGVVGLIRPDGTGQVTLADDVYSVQWLDWSPDGRWLLAAPGLGPVILFDTQTGARLPLGSLVGFSATAWRP